MNGSISNRVFLVVTLSMISMLSTIVLLAWRQAEALEDAFINSFAQAELDYFLENEPKDKFKNTQSAQLIDVYIPNQLAADHPVPSIFSGLQAPFRGEVESLGRVYAVNIHKLPEGMHYYAHDLGLIEEAEDTLHVLVASAAILIVFLSLATAWFAGRHISKPVKELVQAIKKAQAGNTELNPAQFKEVELTTICAAVNQFLQQNKDAMAREKSWMNMASHEFRTPLSIIAGATSVLQKRANLKDEDAKTLARIENACRDMTGYVNTLLAIARRKPLDNPEPVDVPQLIAELISNYAALNPAWVHRIHTDVCSTVQPLGEKNVVKIALDNLISNALTHTEGAITLSVQEDHLAVLDAGAHPAPASPAGGLGLYIVTMACDYLNWHLSIDTKGANRHSILWYQKAAQPARQ